MQYTGFNDINYKQIFEGDVVEGYIVEPCKIDIQGYIFYNKNKACFRVVNTCPGDDCCFLYEIYNIKKIKNKYENI